MGIQVIDVHVVCACATQSYVRRLSSSESSVNVLISVLPGRVNANAVDPRMNAYVGAHAGNTRVGTLTCIAHLVVPYVEANIHHTCKGRSVFRRYCYFSVFASACIAHNPCALSLY